jgi:hypothetical protein
MTVEPSECPRGKHDFGLGEGVAPLEAIFLDQEVHSKCLKCGYILNLPKEPGY